MLGDKISEAIIAVEKVVDQVEFVRWEKPNYTEEGFKSSCRVFMSFIMDRMFDFQDKSEMDIDDRYEMFYDCGSELRKFILKYTGVDTHEMHKE